MSAHAIKRTAALALGLGVPLEASFAELMKLEPVVVTGNFTGEDGAQPAVELSGIACAPAAGVSRRCLVVDDEVSGAQWATLSATGLTVGPFLPLTQGGPPAGAFGTPPKKPESAQAGKNPGDLDGEAITFDGGRFFLVGSMGLSRKKGNYSPSSFLLARITEGQPPDFTFQPATALESVKPVSVYFQKSLNSENGLNVEGLAVRGDELMLGLRGPSLDGSAYIVTMSVKSAFPSESNPPAGAGQAYPLPLGPGMGIRDLASLPDGRLLVLAGPVLDADDKPGQYKVVLHDRTSGTLSQLGTLPDFKMSDGKFAKAEGMALLGASSGQAEMLFVFDGLANGGPQRAIVPLP